MNKLASALTGLGGERVALCDVSVSAVLQDLLAEVAVSQTYRNDERVNIEAVYTFPLPLDAVLAQVDRVAGQRGLDPVQLTEQVKSAAQAGILGPQVVNILQLNLQLDHQKGA